MTVNRPTGTDQNDDYFEERLRRFQPVSPRSLAIPHRRVPPAALAVAACALLAAGAAFIAHPGRQTTIPDTLASPRITVGTMNAALRDKDETLNRLLDQASPKILSRGQRGTVLYELGKE